MASVDKTAALDMLRQLILTFLLCLSMHLRAEDCKPPEPGPEFFDVFFARFSYDKEFSISRTHFPLGVTRWEFLDEKGDGRRVRDYVSRWEVMDEKGAGRQARDDVAKQMNMKSANLWTYMEANGFSLRTRARNQRDMIVEIFKPDTYWTIVYRFYREKACWFLAEYIEMPYLPFGLNIPDGRRPGRSIREGREAPLLDRPVSPRPGALPASGDREHPLSRLGGIQLG